MKKNNLLLTILFIALFLPPFGKAGRGLYAQNIGINTTGSTPNTSAGLDVDFNNKGLLIPRLTTAQRNAIASPAHSLLIYNTTTDCFEAWNQTTSTWVSFGCIGCQLPGTFSASAASGIVATSFSANWTASTGATTYYLDVNTNSSFTGTVILSNQNAGSGTTYSVTGLTCGTAYYYRIRANNGCGTSANSNTITQTTSGCCTPSTVTIGTLTQTTMCVGIYTVVKWTGYGSTTWTVPAGITSIEYIVVGGGGGGGGYWCGGGCSGGLGGGGGAGGYRSSVSTENSGGGGVAEIPLTVTGGSPLSVVVGTGGAGGGNFANGANGNNSTFGSITSAGGGGGGAIPPSGSGGNNGNAGGSGGGGSQQGGLGGISNPATPVQGYAGGNCNVPFDPNGGGGGGAGHLGYTSTGVGIGGFGGEGVVSSITGTATPYAGGGGGGNYYAKNSAGGSGIGGNGGVFWDVVAPTAGTANTGSGGGGASGTINLGGNGSTGIVIIRYIP